MAYIQNPEHFANYLQKVAKDANVAKCLHLSFYIQQIYRKGLADKFTWDLKQQGAALLEEDNVLAWLREVNNHKLEADAFSHVFTEEFLSCCESLIRTIGVYSFWRDDETPLYIGKSINLGARIPESFKRFDQYNRTVFLRYITTGGAADAEVIETHMISTLRPTLNVLGNYGEEMTITIPNVPVWSDPIRINIIVAQSTRPKGRRTQ